MEVSSLQENLLEKPNVLIYDDEMFEFDDSNEINEDTIVVTGFTVRFDCNKISARIISVAPAQIILSSSLSGGKC